MDLDKLNFLPEWENDDFDNEEGEAWKTNEVKLAGKALYLNGAKFSGS